MKTPVAVAIAINYIAQSENKTKEEVVIMLLVEALKARGVMMTKETK